MDARNGAPLLQEAQRAATLAANPRDWFKLHPVTVFKGYPGVLEGALYDHVLQSFSERAILDRNSKQRTNSRNATFKGRRFNTVGTNPGTSLPNTFAPSSPQAPEASSGLAGSADSLAQQFASFTSITFAVTVAPLTGIGSILDPDTSEASLYGVLESSNTSNGLEWRPCLPESCPIWPESGRKSRSKSKSSKARAPTNANVDTAPQSHAQPVRLSPKPDSIDSSTKAYLMLARRRMLDRPEECLNSGDELFNVFAWLIEFPPSPYDGDSSRYLFREFCDHTTIFDKYDNKTIGQYIAWFMDKWTDHDQKTWGGKSFRVMLVYVLRNIKWGLRQKREEEEENAREYQEAVEELLMRKSEEIQDG